MVTPRDSEKDSAEMEIGRILQKTMGVSLVFDGNTT